MAEGRGPNLTMPILTRINFLHNFDPNLFWILNSTWSKKFDRHIFGRSAAMHLAKTVHHMGP